MIGDTVGNFRVIRRLGQGGMGEVWLAEHKDIQTRVAIKMLLPHISADKQHVERFFNEAVAVSKIKHAGIAKIFDVGFHASGNAYLVMEFLDGEPLAGRIARSGRLALGPLCDFAKQIASVLEATHAEGITHRDLKPDNVFLVADSELASGERVKILDFGIAKLAGTKALTHTDGAMGTPTYMSPEQWKSSARVDGRADVYSLGCLVFEMACGRPPFLAESIAGLCTQHLHDPAPSIRSVAPAMPEALDEWVARMLAKQPEDRPTVRQIKEAFAAIGAGQPSAIGPTLYGDDVAPGVAAAASARLPSFAPVRGRTGPQTTLGGSAASLIPAPRPPARTRTLALAAVGLLAVGAGGVVAWQRGAGEPATAVSASTAPPVAPPAPAAAAAPAPVPAAVALAAPVASEVPAPALTSRVDITTVPADAAVLIDDTAVATPFHGTFSRSDVRHRIEVRAPGYRTASQWQTFDADRALVITLVKETDARPGKLPAVARTVPTAHPPVEVRPPVVVKPAQVATPAVQDTRPAPALITAPDGTGAGSGSGSAKRAGYKGTKGSIITDYPPQ